MRKKMENRKIIKPGTDEGERERTKKRERERELAANRDTRTDEKTFRSKKE
jgi:hypothetical protein